ncbi:hypothetical protein DE146DRAFT_676693 [Phaeosphaeria sp. MPI-PUGE-AT-0046c]|nr:hypothetical protein DE146DRAFT_676693 [Phaeosphaeria sp. MPI-PUGE-AT-0046c]
MAHPYAPMGGSYDDRVVGIVVDEFLKHGWMVGTFNFRGAHGSKSRTSWTGRPEVEDYTSFAACFIHYMGYLQPYTARSSKTTHGDNLTPGQADTSPIVILGGYSYGSLILKHLPPVSDILRSSASAVSGSATDEILHRSRTLAQQSNTTWINTARSQEREGRSRTQRHEKPSPVIMGGEETTPDKRKTSRDIRRSVDRGPSGDFGRRLRSFSHSHCRRTDDPTPLPQEIVEIAPMIPPRVHYLLISPLTTPISSLAATGLGQKLWSKSKVVFEDITRQHPTLAIYGDSDIFTSAKRIRDWSEQLKKGTPDSLFSSVEVPRAGHFWVEGGAEEALRNALCNWDVVQEVA